MKIKMPKWLKILIIAIACSAILVVLGFFILMEFIDTDVPKPKSDVEIEYKIDWWGNQDALTVENLEVEVVFDNLNLFNSTALVEYKISGTLKGRGGFRPYIKSVFLSERWMMDSEDMNNDQGDIVLFPIVGSKEDNDYNGETLDFSVKVQDYLSTGGWGNNVYKVSSQSKNDTIELHQSK